MSSRFNSPSTTPTFSDFDEQSDDETSLQLDTSADSIDTSTGVKVFEFLVSGSGTGSTTAPTDISEIPVDVPDEGEITIAAKSLTGGSVTVDFVGEVT